MRELFLKVLAFFLGIKHKSPVERAISGRTLITQVIIKSLALHISKCDIKDIWLLGTIKYSEEKLEGIKKIFIEDGKYNFPSPSNFDFKGDYIDFYQISTSDWRTFILAMTDKYSGDEEDKILMILEVNERQNTEKLPPAWKYYNG